MLQFLHDNYVFLDTALKQHVERRNGRVIILGCGDRVELLAISRHNTTDITEEAK